MGRRGQGTGRVTWVDTWFCSEMGDASGQYLIEFDLLERLKSSTDGVLVFDAQVLLAE